MFWGKAALITLAVLVVGGLSLAWYLERPLLVASVDETRLPKFIQHDVIDLSRVQSISKFRSGSGHDFSSHGETCRSMKHYLKPARPVGVTEPSSGQTFQGAPVPPAPTPSTEVTVVSPVAGSIQSIVGEQFPVGQQFSIRPDSHPGYSIRLFHIYPAAGIHAPMHVTAGQPIGEISEFSQLDIAVEATTLGGPQFVSYFQVMPDSVFANYQAHGISSRDDLIITKADRDAHPYHCNGEQFAQNYQDDPNYTEEAYLAGYSRATKSRSTSEASPPANSVSAGSADPSTSTTAPSTQNPAATKSSRTAAGGWRDELTAFNANRFNASDNWTNGAPFAVGWRVDHVTFGNDQLTLTLDNAGCPVSCSGQPSASGEYRTTAVYGYGKVEARLKPAKGSGLMAGSLFTYTGPADGQPHDEIDIEFLGNDTTKLQTNYYTNDVGGHETLVPLGFDAAADFHTYAFDWTPTSITWSVDGQPVHSEDGSRGPLPTHPGRIMANLWAGTGVDSWLGPFTYSGKPITASYDWIGYTPNPSE